ncbi:Ig-like domain-containing protein [Listeria booriae]|uniref:immunoglobulin-like domain-containing protein n=1 Tax=Listeria booriae TaxID=1552123 RepID=UPI0028809B4E|nr:immunoglobulin-like domain-containing protein [Listeria booriae]MDT0110916.1 Ig-like domain-containing protein [Listeria booriae]
MNKNANKLLVGLVAVNVLASVPLTAMSASAAEAPSETQGSSKMVLRQNLTATATSTNLIQNSDFNFDVNTNTYANWYFYRADTKQTISGSAYDRQTNVYTSAFSSAYFFWSKDKTNVAYSGVFPDGKRHVYLGGYTYKDNSQYYTTQKITTIPGQKYKFVAKTSTGDIGNNAIQSNVAISSNNDFTNVIKSQAVDSPATGRMGATEFEFTATSNETYIGLGNTNKDGLFSYIYYGQPSVTLVLNAPVIASVTSQDTSVTVTGEANAKISITLPDGSEMIKTAGADGKASFVIPKLEPGAVITANQTLGGDVSNSSSATVGLGAPVLSTVTDHSTSITVTGDAGNDITLIQPDGTRTTKTANAQGQATFAVSGLVADQIIKASQTKNGQTSPLASTTVQATALDAPTIAPVTSADTKLVVTGEPGAKITITLPDGTDMSKTAGSDGKATFTIGTQEVGDVITATQTGANGKTSAPASITVTAGSIAAPTISSLTTEDTAAKGTGIAGATVTITANSINYTGTVAADGTYSITIPKQAAGATVTAKQEKGGITSNSVSTKVIDNRTPVAPTVNPVKDSDTTVTGTGTKGDTIKVTTPDGETYTTVVGDDGKWSVTIPAQEAGAKIDATATAPNGNTSPKKEVSVLETPQTGKLTTGDFTIGKDKYIVGTFTGDVKNFRVTIGTNVYTGGSIDTAKGTYTFYALDKATQPGTFKIEALDKYGHVLDTKTANIVKASSDNTPGTGTVTAAGFVIGQDKNVTGTFTGDVKSIKLVYDGTTYSGGTLTNGNYTFYALDKITDKTKSARIDGYDAKGNKIATSAVALSNKNDNGSGVGVGTVTANDFTLSTDSNIIGTYTGDVKSIKVRVGDTTYSGGTLTSGNYTFYARDKISSTTQVVFVDGYDAKGNKIATTAVTVKANGLPATTGTIAPNTFNVPADKYLTASYTGDVKSVVVTINGTKYTGGTVADGLVNFYIGNKITSSSDVVSIEAFDAYGRSLQSKAVTVNQSNSQTTGTVTPDTFTTPGDSYLTGSYTGDVKSVIVTINGTDYTGGTVADGKINFWIGSKISKASDVVTIKGVDAAGKTLDTKTVTVLAAKAEVGTIIPAEFSLKTSAIKGTYTGNAKTILVTVNGLALPAGGTVADGNFSYYVGLKTKVTAKSDAVTVTLLDKNGLVMDTKSVTIVD